MTRVLVTGAGGPAGIAVIQDLVNHGHFVVACDSNPWGAGLYLANEHSTIPYANSDDFLPEIVRLIEEYSIDALISTVAEELEILSENKSALSQAGAAIWLPNKSTVAVANDKLLFARTLQGAGVPHPQTETRSENIGNGPWVVKPRSGRGSRDVSYPTTLEQVEEDLRALQGNGIVQTQATGKEFTADTLTLSDGKTWVGARWRIETKAGISTRGETFQNDAVTKAVTDTLVAIGHQGPGCVQGFLDDGGNVTIIELNPRFSGGLPLTLASGMETVEQYLRVILGESVQEEKLQAKPGIKMSRYFQAIYLDENGDELSDTP